MVPNGPAQNTLVLSTQVRVWKGRVYPTFEAPYIEGTIRVESRGKVSAHPPARHRRHMVGKCILAHNSLSRSH